MAKVTVLIDSFLKDFGLFFYRFDFTVNQSTREIDLFVPHPELKLVQKFSGLKVVNVSSRLKLY
jgi:hypothetical protein